MYKCILHQIFRICCVHIASKGVHDFQKDVCTVHRYTRRMHVVKVSNFRQSPMANGHLGLGSNIQLGLVDFKVCDWPPETSLNGQLPTLKSCWPNFKILLAN